MSKPRLNQSKNIVISTQCFPPVIGGMENLIKGLADSLYKNNFKVFIFADSKKYLNEENYDKKLPYEIVRYKGLKIIRKRKKSLDIKKFINYKKKINSIFCDSWKSAENLIKLKLIDHTNIFCLAHGNDVLVSKNILKRRRIKKIMNKVDCVIANSFFTREKIIKLGINKRKIKVIYPGLNLQSVKLKNNKSFNKYKNFYPIFLTVARLEKRKNHKNIIYAIRELVKKYKNLIYFIAGDGPEKKKLLKLISKLKLKKNIKLLGNLNEIDKAFLLKISNLHLMPTIEDKKKLLLKVLEFLMLRQLFMEHHLFLVVWAVLKSRL